MGIFAKNVLNARSSVLHRQTLIRKEDQRRTAAILYRYVHISIAILLSLLAAGVTLVLAQAKNDTPGKPIQENSACIVCHKGFASAWQNGPHEQAVCNPQFETQ
jgi:hypothetical protein